MSISDEINRILEDSDHVIISKDLEGVLEVNESPSSEENFLIIGGSSFVCQVKKLSVSGGDIVFSLEVPALDIRDILVSDSLLEVRLKELRYTQSHQSELIWEDNLLTLKTRRIFNETV